MSFVRELCHNLLLCSGPGELVKFAWPRPTYARSTQRLRTTTDIIAAKHIERDAKMSVGVLDTRQECPAVDFDACFGADLARAGGSRILAGSYPATGELPQSTQQT